MKDYLSFYVSEFSDYEISVGYLYSIIEQIDDIETLRQIDEVLSKTEHINPLDMKTIRNKIAEAYKREYLNSTLTLDKVEKMAETGENGSHKGILKADGTLICEEYKITADKDKVQRALLPTGEIITKTIHPNKSESYSILYPDGTEKNDEPIVFNVDEKSKVEMSVDENGDVHQMIKVEIGDNVVKKFFLTNSQLQYIEGYYGGEKRLCITAEQAVSGALAELQEVQSNPVYKEMQQKYLPELEERMRLANPKKLFESGQLLKNELIKKDGDLLVYFVNANEQTFFHHAERGFTSQCLRDRINSQVGENLVIADYTQVAPSMPPEYMCIINNELEGGLSTISAYYNSRPAFKCGYVNKINPNSIFKFSPTDAGVSHKVKKLFDEGDPSERMDINPNLLHSFESSTEIASEIAYLRYEWDITKIQPGSKGGKILPEYVFTGDYDIPPEEAAKFALCAGVPCVAIKGRRREQYLEKAPKREESSNIKKLKKNLEQIAEGTSPLKEESAKSLLNLEMILRDILSSKDCRESEVSEADKEETIRTTRESQEKSVEGMSFDE